MTIPVVYRTKDRKKLRRKYKPGDIVQIRERQVKCENGKKYVATKAGNYRVADLYPYHVSMINSFGMRESFDYFELEHIIAKRSESKKRGNKNE